jgi:hypothetical protein
MTPHRIDDPQTVSIHRAVPFSWLLGLVGLVLGQAVILYFDVKALKEASIEYRAELRKVVDAVGVVNLRDVEHAQRLGDIERRLQDAEAEVRLLRSTKR